MSVELSNELLRTMVDVLDVHDVFPRIAQAANHCFSTTAWIRR